MDRIDKENYYLDIAQTVQERSTCLRKRYGAILFETMKLSPPDTMEHRAAGAIVPIWDTACGRR